MFNGSKVFISLRPDIFGVDREHITLEYIGAFPTWDTLIEKCQEWQNILGSDIKVKVNGFANWKHNLYYKVALIDFVGRPALSMSKNWHITLEQSDKPFTSVPIITEESALEDTCYELWVGYADAKGNKHWISYSKLSKRLIPELSLPSV